MSWGEYEKDISKIDVLDLCTANVPLADDLSVRSCVSDAGFKWLVIYSGVRLLARSPEQKARR